MKKKNILWLLAIVFIASINIQGCKKDDGDDTPDPVEDPTKVKDIDGNVYNVIQIGSQYWLKENLRVSRFRNGDPITNLSDGILWRYDSVGGWCVYGNTASNEAVYGKLYNFYAVVDSRNMAPEGWHVASAADWKTLINYLGDSTMVGGKLKEAGTAHWVAPNVGATNSTNFTALPGGQRGNTGNYAQMGGDAFFWTTSEDNPDMARCYFLDFNINGVYSYSFLKNYGFSVRCVKN